MEERKILDSWKEIAEYLSRSVITCQRWEEQLGLPIHRLDGTPKARVFAYTDELDRWLAEKLHVAEAPRQERHKRTKWIWITAGAVLVMAAIAAIGWQLFSQAFIPTPAQVLSLAVLPFENRTGDGAWDAWKTALPDLITIDLRQSRFTDVIRTSSLFQSVGSLAEAEKFSSEDLKKVAEKADVDYAITGNLTKSAEGFIITALVHNARTGDVMASPRSTCRTEKDIFSSVDEMSKEVKIALNLRPREIRRDIDKPVARIATNSPQAFKFYSQGYRIQGKRKYDEAISPLLKAVELDPKFGLAHILLSRSYQATDREEERKKYGGMAVELADRIDERERCGVLSGFYRSEHIDRKKYLQVYQRFGKKYPDDLNMAGLASNFSGQEEWDKALPILEKITLRFPKKSNVIQSLSDCYISMGLYDKAEKLLDDNMSANLKPGTEMMSDLERRLKLALVQKKFDVAHEYADRLITTFPNLSSGHSWKGFTYFMQDDFANAEKMYKKLVERDDKRTQREGFRYLASVSLSRGRIEEAKQRILRAIELDKIAGRPYLEGEYHYFLAYLERLSGRLPEALEEAELACRGLEGPGLRYVRKLYLRALITVEMNRFEEFEKQIEEVKRYLDPDRSSWGAPRFMRVYYNLLGHRELQKNNYDLAIPYFRKALDLISVFGARFDDNDHAQYFYDLAEAYRRRDSSERFSPDALPMYDKVTLPTVSRQYSGDLYAKSHYWMGLEWERMIGFTGTPADAQERRLKAIGYYRKFLDLWKDADPIFPEIEDARKRLDSLLAQ